MTDDVRRDLDLGEDDSLPWLETADDYDKPDGPSTGKVVLLVVAGLALIAVIFGGIFAYHNNSQEQSGNGELIAAQEGDYKVAPEDPQGKQFEGEGDAAFAASEGKSRESNAMPAKPAPPEPKATPAAAASSAAAGANAPASGGVLVQLAALNSEAAAEQQWSKLSGQYEYLKDMRHRVVKAEVEGRTVYRLSAVSSDRANANTLCNRIKSDGGSCLIAG
ncbi:SPOR domain-containing protein [Novosphingopyxis iocasae]|uniref:SPOR domain-containing protein n=1 Tax=Novosphingopyxis iocasae TaxID=2762729 RepID=UPI001650D7B1|nr:SPOR domain-containing protein [Novosphingopyxis iocasae]